MGLDRKNKNMLSKTLAIGIIVLFIGVGIHPAFAVDTKLSINKKVSEEDCNCKEIDSRHLAVLERQLNRLEVYSKLLLVLSRYNSELKEMSEELLDEITTLKEELTDDPPYPVICGIIDNILNSIAQFVWIYEQRFESCEPGTLERIIWGFIYYIVQLILYPPFLAIWGIGFFLGCWVPWSS